MELCDSGLFQECVALRNAAHIQDLLFSCSVPMVCCPCLMVKICAVLRVLDPLRKSRSHWTKVELRDELGIEMRASHSTVMQVPFFLKFFFCFLMTGCFLSSWQGAL